jgi:hypothetical protein
MSESEGESYKRRRKPVRPGAANPEAETLRQVVRRALFDCIEQPRSGGGFPGPEDVDLITERVEAFLLTAEPAVDAGVGEAFGRLADFLSEFADDLARARSRLTDDDVYPVLSLALRMQERFRVAQ